MTESAETRSVRHVPIADPTPARKKRIIELFNKFLEDKVSLAELKGIGRDKLYQLSEAGWVKFKHGRIEEAEQIFRSLLILDHRNAYFHAMMGAIMQKKKRPVEAILEYTRALQINGKDISTLVNRGEIYLRHRNFKKAAEDFKNAILLDMSGRNLWANRARSLVIALKRSMDAGKKK
jgi:Flp pilus assembly protein TadD